MWKVFSMKGSVADVVIPPKKDKVGRRFDFVRFKQVNDIVALENRLKNVWIGDFKVQVNRPKYERNQLRKANMGDPNTRRRNQEEGLPSLKVSGWKDALTGEGHDNRKIPEFNPAQEDLEELQECFVGELLRFKDAPVFQDLLFKEGFFTIKATPMGGAFVLLQGADKEELPKLLSK
ncbi:hypothetical protein RIF29_26442 [Crotalaria pallida]|uniref:RRM domain-containing protein n=1 Tax=Crotalaria pallida TaxID=3830 RepID=A0AAN9EMQ1_CROPI